MLANYEEHGLKITAKVMPDTCTSCPFWCLNLENCEKGICSITGTEIIADGPQDTKRMDDCPLEKENKNMNVFTEISTRELENTLKGKAVRYIVNDAGEGLCLFFEGWTDNTGSNHGDAIHISPVIDAAGKPQLVVQYVPEEERPEDSETSNNGVVGE